MSDGRATSILTPAPSAPHLSDLECRLMDEYQHGLPVCGAPFDAIARSLGVCEGAVLETLASLQRRGLIARVGPVLAPNRAGSGTLAALAVPPERLDAVAELVNDYDEVNHNYEREHDFNLWFVVTGEDRDAVEAVLADIEARTGLEVLDLPLERAYHIDLGFPLWR